MRIRQLNKFLRRNLYCFSIPDDYPQSRIWVYPGKGHYIEIVAGNQIVRPLSRDALRWLVSLPGFWRGVRNAMHVEGWRKEAPKL
jgi:hypothetical protein